MCKPKTLLFLLNARGRNHPSQFAATDGEAMYIGTVSAAIMPIFLNEHTMLLNGIANDKDYGKLLSWDEHEDAFEWMHTRKQFLPGEGLLILEAQDRLLAFLVDCCLAILHEIPPDELLDNARYPIMPEPPLKETAKTPDGSTSDGVIPSLSAMAEEAPYRLPEKLDLDRIEQLLAARKASAEDHAWALREDPGYFADEVLQMREHHQEMLKDVNGNVHPTMRSVPSRQGILWSRVLGDVLVEGYFQLDMFTELHRQAKELRALHEKFATKISPLEDLPEPFLGALLKFRHYLLQAAKGPVNQLMMSFVASPPMRRFYVREVPVSATSSKIVTMSKPGVTLDEEVLQLVWLLRTLWEDDKTLFLCGMTNIIDELDRLLNTEARARECVSPYIARMIGELAIVGECLRQLKIYQPWANGFETALVDRQDGIKREFAERMQLNTRILDAFSDKNVVSIRARGDPSDSKFAYPVGKHPNQANVQALRTAEANLDAFWADADELVRSKAGSLEGSAMQALLSQPRLLQRTPEWVEPVPKAANKKKSVKAAGADQLSGPMSSVFLGPKEETSARKGVLEVAPSKTKAKTRGTGYAFPAEGNDVGQLADPPAVVDPQPIFRVDARTLKVFRIVFFDPDANTTPGEVAWKDFLHAMQETGFAAQKLYGSVWHFQPTTLDVEKSIQFHEPHPQGKIPFFVARRHGRRLSRVYGWHGGMFLLK